MLINDPAPYLMGKLRYPVKLGLISTVFLLPLIVVMGFFQTETNDGITIVTQERQGLAYDVPLNRLMTDTAQGAPQANWRPTSRRWTRSTSRSATASTSATTG